MFTFDKLFVRVKLNFMNNLKEKLLAFFIGFFTIILLLEVGLRVGAKIYSKRITSENKLLSSQNEDYNILCVGDSFTVGMGTAYEYSYPRQLEEMLNAGYLKKRFKVFNAGVLGQNSSQAFKKLENNVKQYNPNLIIVLVTPKRENLDDSNYWLFADKKEMGTKGYYYKRIDYFLTKFRTYRLLKLLKLNLKNRTMLYKTNTSNIVKKEPPRKQIQENKSKEALNIEQDKEKEYLDSAFVYLRERKLELARQQAKKALEINSRNEQGYLYLAISFRLEEMYDLAKAEINKLIEINPNYSSAYSELGSIYYYESRNKPDIKEKNLALAIEALNKVIDINPRDEQAYWVLGEIYFFEQGRTDLAIKATKKLLELNPANENYKLRLKVYSPPIADIDKRIFDKLLEYDLENIVELAISRGVKIILMGYPDRDFQDYIRRKVAVGYGIPFIDNYSVFKELLQKYSWKDLFSDDGTHCNKNGYKVIAEEIYKVLKSNF